MSQTSLARPLHPLWVDLLPLSKFTNSNAQNTGCPTCMVIPIPPLHFTHHPFLFLMIVGCRWGAGNHPRFLRRVSVSKRGVRGRESAVPSGSTKTKASGVKVAGSGDEQQVNGWVRGAGLRLYLEASSGRLSTWRPGLSQGEVL